MSWDEQPVVIGGTGGSGTRVFAVTCEQAGFYMGDALNFAHDSKIFAPLLSQWVNPYLMKDTSSFQAEEMEAALREAIHTHRNGIGPERRWGWKNPRIFFILPEIHKIFPQMKFIHVVRDGRDIAFSRNQNQPNLHGAALLGSQAESQSVPDRAITFWNNINLKVARYGETHLGDHYLRIKLEDMCLNTQPTLSRMLEFLGVNGQGLDQLAGHVETPESINRWQKEDDQVIASLHELGREALEYFGYLKANSKRESS